MAQGEDRCADCGELAMPLGLRASETGDNCIGTVMEAAVQFWPGLCTSEADIWSLLNNRFGMEKPSAVIVSGTQSCISKIVILSV